MTKADLVKQLLSLLQGEQLISSFKLEEDNITVCSEKKNVCLNLSQSLSHEPNIIRDLSVTAPIYNEDTSEIYYNVNLKLYPEMVQDLSSFNKINEYYLIGKQFSEQVKSLTADYS